MASTIEAKARVEESAAKPKNDAKSLILQEINSFCENSTSHGIPKITRSKNKFLKLMWILVFVSSTGYCIHALIQDFQNYFKYAVLTFVDTKYEIPALMPAVTICGVDGPMDTSRLKSCVIKRGIRLPDVNCWASDFTKVNVPEYSNCYVYNSGINAEGKQIGYLRVNETGQQSGVRFDLNIGETESFDVFIHEQNVCALNEQNINIVPDSVTEVGLRRTMMIKKAKPYSNCVENPKIFPHETSLYFKDIKNTTRYAQKLCYSFCMKYYLGKLCSNAYSNITGLYKSKECSALSNILKMCTEKCPVECESIIFVSTILTKNIQSNNTVTALHVYYEETQYMRINEVPAVTPEAFIGNIGGELGLFVGISLLSLIEVLELIINIIVILFNNYKAKRKIVATATVIKVNEKY